jgi:pyruvate dehydrogenase E2 component (dihydrolipoyllysine-residue acetyltransferase)
VSTQIVRVPDIGGAEGVEVIEICIAVGDQVEQEDSLVVLESDKASMEVPSPVTGKVVAISIATGDSLSEGDVILEMEVDATNDSAAASAAAVQSGSEEKKSSSEPQAAVESTPSVSPEAAPAVDSSAVETIKVPDIGGAEDAEVIEVCVSVGDEVEEGDSLIVLETDKASMEVPAPKAGKVVSITMKDGDTASEGAVILDLEVAGSAQVAAPSVSESPVKAPAPSPAPVQPAQVESAAPKVQRLTNDSTIPAPAFASFQLTGTQQKKPVDKPKPPAFYAGPAVRKLARELGVDLVGVKGSGPRGRIAKDDLKLHVKYSMQGKASTTQGAGIPAVPAVDFSVFGDIEIQAMSKIQKITATNMQRNWLNVPHVTQFDDADISELEDFRKSLKDEAQRRSTKITPLPFILKACAHVLKNNPKFNASLHSDGEHLVLKKYVHIGVAVDTPAGLVVPVIRDVDKKSIWQLAKETADLAGRAKDRKLKPSEMQGGCFTISSLGGIGGQGFTPIVNAPEVGILGVSKLAIKPAWNGSEFIPRKMLPLALSYDHRAINGVDGGKFLTELTRLLADVRHLVL